jgi:LysM repeat protein
MSFHIKAFYLVLFVAGTLGLQSCSTQQKSGGEALPLDAGGTESGADAVGSIPEDMLAEEKGPAEGVVADSPNAADPFNDLKESEENAAASDVEEGSSGGSAGTGNMKTYTVKAGDTLMKIAFSLYGDIDRWKDLRDWNKGKLKNANKLSGGMHLTYDEPSAPFQAAQHSHTYEIKKGDTLAGIADEVYGRKAKFKKLQKFNSRLIKNPHRIFAGFTIFYDITEQEVAEAEARRKERMAGGEAPAETSSPVPAPESMVPSEAAAVPSPIAPVPEAAPAAKEVASRPASVPQAGPPSPGSAQMVGPPSPGK